jgi:hypothetical protein
LAHNCIFPDDPCAPRTVSATAARPNTRASEKIVVTAKSLMRLYVLGKKAPKSPDEISNEHYGGQYLCALKAPSRSLATLTWP